MDILRFIFKALKNIFRALLNVSTAEIVDLVIANILNGGTGADGKLARLLSKVGIAYGEIIEFLTKNQLIADLMALVDCEGTPKECLIAALSTDKVRNLVAKLLFQFIAFRSENTTESKTPNSERNMISEMSYVAYKIQKKD